LNCQYLLGNNGKHFKINSIEFIKAVPAARRGKTFKEFAHSDVV